MTLDITVVIGTFAGMLVGFYGIARVMLNQAVKEREQASKDRESDRVERKELAKAIKDMAGATGRVADATVKSAEEAKARNGHLGKQNVHIADLAAQGNEMVKQLLDQALKTAVINAEDRDILTNQNLHIKTEVHKEMDKEGK